MTPPQTTSAYAWYASCCQPVVNTSPRGVLRHAWTASWCISSGTCFTSPHSLWMWSLMSRYLPLSDSGCMPHAERAECSLSVAGASTLPPVLEGNVLEGKHQLRFPSPEHPSMHILLGLSCCEDLLGIKNSSIARRSLKAVLVP